VSSKVRQNYEKLAEKAAGILQERDQNVKVRVQVGSATCELAAGSDEVMEEFQKHIEASGRDDIAIHQTGCTGRCSCEPIVGIIEEGKPPVKYERVDRDIVHKIFTQHINSGEVVTDNLLDGGEKSEQAPVDSPVGADFKKIYGDVDFFSKQLRIALRHNGVIDPESVPEYFHYKGFDALAAVLEKNDPDALIQDITTANLRGRGGGGFSTGMKWKFGRDAESDEKFIVCNADEGDPGAFMGGLLGEDILGSGFGFDLEVRLGAGAFVCGEETALIHSLEGQRGRPRLRPPFPTESGVYGKPTVINNVETFANVTAIIRYGAEWFSSLGVEKSGGTKTFALAGKVNHIGLIEVPMGISLAEIVETIGGGAPGGKDIKAVQTGGPAGGCIPAKLLDLEVDYDSLQKEGSIMGSGGMIVLDEDDCMVDIAKFFMDFTQDESCGKCTPCREGTKRMVEILGRITDGNGVEGDVEKLNRLGNLLKKTALCGLGKAAPNPVLSTIRHFREEYDAHIVEKKCPAKKCKKLVSYHIDAEKCIGCTACARICPVGCISGEKKATHVIKQSECIKCGECYNTCRFAAIEKR